jgi:nicotinate-nucleotide pyrophosphorylase (carboxylating)
MDASDMVNPEHRSCVGSRLNALPLDTLYDELNTTGLADRLLRLAIDEDLGGPDASPSADVTSALVAGARDVSQRVVCDVRARTTGVLAGLRPATDLCAMFDGVTLRAVRGDGDHFEPGEVVATVSGPGQLVTTAERPLLNLLGRLSGVATETSRYVRAAGDAVRVCDTRKTTPGLRVLEKYAVRCGGGWLHRIGLFDAVLVKDNHLAGLDPDRVGQLAADVVARAATLRDRSPAFARDGFVEIEVDTLEQLAAIFRLSPGVDVVLLDNMARGTLREAVAMRSVAGVRTELEASGGVTMEAIRDIARTGVDRISTGAITHHAVWIDFGLDAR